MNQRNKVSQVLKQKGFPLLLKKNRRKYGFFSAEQAAKAAAMPLRTYKAYESGETIPHTLALASGLLFAVGTPEKEIHRLFYQSRLKRPRSAAIAMTAREEALLQWFDQALQHAFQSKKASHPLVGFYCLIAAIDPFWRPWKTTAEMRRALLEYDVKVSHEALSKRIEKVQHQLPNEIRLPEHKPQR